jgi:hypothetical protein
MWNSWSLCKKLSNASSEGLDNSSDDEIENGEFPELWEVDSDKEEDTTAVRPPGVPGLEIWKQLSVVFYNWYDPKVCYGYWQFHGSDKNLKPMPEDE